MINIFRGEMTFIGPRPVIDADSEILDRRKGLGLFRLKPGVTFLDRLMGGEELDVDERLDVEYAYLQERSFWGYLIQDFRIIVRSFSTVLK
ncbi:MAG: O-antigen biosynthesis protein WbqP [Saprospiraceae bacterium]